MRKRKLVIELQKIVNNFNIEAINNGNGIYSIQNHNTLIKKVHQLEELGLFSSDIDNIKLMSDIYDNFMDTLTLGYENYSKYSTYMNNLKTKGLGVIEASSVFLTKEFDHTINFKLPEIEKLTELSDCINDFNKAVSGILFDDKVRQEIKLTGFDSGSMWLEICVQSSIAVSLIGNAAWAALVVKEKINENEKMKKNIEMVDINIEHMNALKDGLEKSIKILVESESKNILDSMDINKEEDSNYNETHNRMMMSIKLLSDLFQKGAEIHGQLNQPVEVENPFPNYKASELITSRIKQIPNNLN